MIFTTLGFAVLVFVSVIMALSFMLITARKKLVPQGDVKIIVNGDTENPLTVNPGSTLLGALSDCNVFLPSACGGGGTCAMCECHVDAGGGDILPTELNHITRKRSCREHAFGLPGESSGGHGNPNSRGNFWY